MLNYELVGLEEITETIKARLHISFAYMKRLMARKVKKKIEQKHVANN